MALYFPRTIPALLLAACCLPALAADPVCQRREVGSLAIHYSDPGMKPSIEGSVNGKPIKMLVDTGASVTMLMAPTAEAAGVVLTGGSQRIRGIGGLERFYIGKVDALTIGPVKLNNSRIRVLDVDAKQERYGGVVGVDFLLQMDMQLSLAQRKITFYSKQQDCSDAFLDPAGKSIVLDYLSIDDNDTRPSIEVTINGKKLRAVLDSGAYRSAIFRRGAKSAGITPDSPGVLKNGKVSGVGDYSPDAWRIPVNSFSVGGNSYTDLKMTMIDDDHQTVGGADILLGADFLRAYDVLFAKSQRKAYLTYRGGPVFATDYRAEASWYREEADLGNLRAQNQVGRDLFIAGDFKASATYLGGGTKAKPDNPYTGLLHYVALARSGDRDGASHALGIYRATLAERQWTTAMADFLLGRIDGDALLALRDTDPAKRKNQTCEATYAQAQHKLLTAEREPARALLETAKADCPATKFERAAAAAELQRWQ
jgi:predicted aspartyl protease